MNTNIDLNSIEGPAIVLELPTNQHSKDFRGWGLEEPTPNLHIFSYYLREEDGTINIDYLDASLELICEKALDISITTVYIPYIEGLDVLPTLVEEYQELYPELDLIICKEST